MDPHQDVLLQTQSSTEYLSRQLCVCVCVSYKALCSVVHDAELKPLLVLVGFGERTAERVGRQDFLTAVLKLSEDALWREEAESETGS